MPIYEYQCSACGHQEDHLCKVSDAPLTKCPACGKKKYQKQLTAAGFQLKGSGWYATDFKGGKKPDAAKPEAKADVKDEVKSEAKTEAQSATKIEAKTSEKTEVKAQKKTPVSTTN
ncbi:MAG: zinc ribbon domain-containing protein [Betaproteobacteria bacterium]|nr:zinc ribbon domain-containing protein [Betaproteobacteria bacterium]MSQ89152.1 zinc ribbon domain-containing protein [Betaproteobacteria bacterium]